MKKVITILLTIILLLGCEEYSGYRVSETKDFTRYTIEEGIYDQPTLHEIQELLNKTKEQYPETNFKDIQVTIYHNKFIYKVPK